MYAVLHARNWHSKNHRYLTLYPKGICFPKNNHIRLSATGNWDIISIMKDPPKTPSFLYSFDATKNAINQISQILQRRTYQPRLQILPLPTMLPQSQNENIQHQNIISTPALYLRVEPVSQPLRVQTQDPVSTPPPIEQPSTFPSVNPPSNPWIEKL